MKADIPDKILINRDEDGKIHHSYWTADQQLIPFEDVEYIRKDALLEKLEIVAASYKKRSDEGELVWQNMCGVNEAINILNSM